MPTVISGPSLSNPGGAADYLAGGAYVLAAPGLTLSDTESATVSSATVSITGGFQSGDLLEFGNWNGITGSYDAATGVLSLSGTASLAAYQQALESIAFASTLSDPTVGGTDATRTLAFTVDDGVHSSTALTSQVQIETAPAGTATSNSYTASGENWDSASSWFVNGFGAATPPGANDYVNFESGLGVDQMAGFGAAASVNLDIAENGSVLFTGQISTGVLATGVGDGPIVLASGAGLAAGAASISALTLEGGATASFTGTDPATVAHLTEAAGASFTVAGDLNLEGTVSGFLSVLGDLTNTGFPNIDFPDFGPLTIDNGGHVRAGGVDEFSGALTIDPTSTFEVGTQSLATPGALVIDQGATFEVFQRYTDNYTTNFAISATTILNNGLLQFDASTTSPTPPPPGPGQDYPILLTNSSLVASDAITNNGTIAIAADAVVFVQMDSNLDPLSDGPTINNGAIDNEGQLFVANFTNNNVINNDGDLYAFVDANSGVINSTSSLQLQSITTNTGTINASGVFYESGLAGVGQINLLQAATFEVHGAIGAGQTIDLTGEGVLVYIASASLAVAGTFVGFDPSDTMHVAAAADRAAWSNGVLTLYEGTTVVDSFQLQGSYGSDGFTTTSDGQGGTIVQEALPGQEVAPSPNPAAPVDTTVTTISGASTIVATYGPDGALIQTARSYLETGTAYPVNVTVFDNALGAQFATTIVQTPSTDETIVQHLDGNWNQLSATITEVNGGQTVVQDFGPSWNLTDSSITTVTTGETIVQHFDTAWNQTSAVITQQLPNGVTETQHFDGNWNQITANLTTDMANGDVLSQDFGASWNQTDATLVSHPTVNQTITQTFDGGWNQTGATVVTVNGNQTLTQDFDSGWHITGGTVVTQVNSTAVTTQTDTYNAYWQMTAETDTAPDGSSTYFDYSVPNLATQTLAATTGHSTTFVLAEGTVNGDTLAGLHTLNLGGAIHDVVEFEGFGAGATVTQVNATQWVINDPTLGTHEYFTLTGGATLGAGDYFFH